MASAVQLKVFLLGRVAVETDGTVIDEARFPGRQGRLLFAYLVAEQGRPVPRDELAEALWGEAPPVTWDKALTVIVSKVRGLLADYGEGATALTSAFGCYRLVLPEPTWVDVIVAANAAQEADEALAAADLEQAKASAALAARLLRQPFLPGETGMWVEEKRRELTDIREHALGALAEACLRSGEPEEAVKWAEQTIALAPFRETGYRRLMEAHIAAGNRAEALQVYERCRRLLADELGAYPSPETETIYRGLLEAPPIHDVTSDAHEATGPALVERRARVRTGRRRLGVVLACGAAALVATAVASWELTRDSPGAVTIIDPGISPGSIAVDRDVGWATNAATNSVSRIDLRTNVRAGTVPVGDSPAGIAAGGGFVWVTNSLGESVTKIDPRGNGGSGSVVDTIAVGNGPSGLTFGGGRVWVANSLDHTVSEIAPSSPSASRPIAVPAGADAIAYGFGSLWVVSGSANTVTRIDAQSHGVLARITVGNDPTAIAVGGGAVWVANSLDGTVSRIDPSTATVVRPLVYVGGSPTSIAAGSGVVWVGDPRLAALTRIDPDRDKVVETRHTTDPPQGLAVSADRLYATVGPPWSAHRGGTLTVLTYPFDSIDPAVAYELQVSWPALGMTNDGLLTYQRVGGTDGIRIVPDLATSLPAMSDAGRTYTFQVRRGIHYSNGTLVRPADFRRAIERALHQQALKQPLGAGLYFEQIVGSADCVKKPERCDLRKGIATDPSLWTVTFHLTHPDSDFLDKLALPTADAVPANTPFQARLPLPATGPYMIASYDAKRGATLVRNPSFHEWSASAQPLGYPAKIVYTFNKPEQASVSAVEHGLGDYTTLEDPDATAALRRSGYGSQVHSNPELAIYYFFLNTTMPPFNRVDVRRAVNYAVDRDRLARLYAAGSGLTAQSTCQILAPDTVGYVRSCLYPSDLAKAKRLVAESGTTGRTVTVSTGPPGLKASGYLVSVLDSLGYNARLKAYKTVDAFHAVRGRGQVEIGPASSGADFPAPSVFFAQLLTCVTARSPALNRAAFCDQRIDREIDHASTLATGSQAAAVAWSRIDHDVMQEAPWVPIANGAEVDLISRRVGNYQFNPFWGVLPDQLWVR